MSVPCALLWPAQTAHAGSELVGEYTVSDTRNAHSFDAKGTHEPSQDCLWPCSLYTLHSPSRGAHCFSSARPNRPHFSSDLRFPSRGFKIPQSLSLRSPLPSLHSLPATETGQHSPYCFGPVAASPVSQSSLPTTLYWSCQHGVVRCISVPSSSLAELLIPPLASPSSHCSAPPRFHRTRHTDSGTQMARSATLSAVKSAHLVKLANEGRLPFLTALPAVGAVVFSWFTGTDHFRPTPPHPS